MNNRSFCLILIALFVIGSLVAVAADPKPPGKLTYETKQGNVVYDHPGHVKHAKGDCKVCHPKLWPQAKGPLNYKAGMHKVAEQKKASCAACHVKGGTAFASMGNCAKCHQKKGAAKS